MKRWGAFVSVESGRSCGRRLSVIAAGVRRTSDIKVLRKLLRDGGPTIILCDNQGQCERLDELLSDDERGFSPGAALAVVRSPGRIHHPRARAAPRAADLHRSRDFSAASDGIRRSRRYTTGVTIDSLSLKEGDYVVHLEQGIGI